MTKYNSASPPAGGFYLASARTIGASLLLLLLSPLWAEQGVLVTALDSNTPTTPVSSDVLPTFTSGADVLRMQQCVQKTKQTCAQYTAWEQNHACSQAALTSIGSACAQTTVLYQKFGLLPNKMQAVGPVTLFTLLHPGDGQETFHMIDSTGALIDLVDERTPTIASSAEFKKIQKKTPAAGVTPWLADPVSESPQVVEPKALANKKGENMIQLTYRQYVKSPPCLSCAPIAIAGLTYQFTPEGKFIGVKWSKTDSI